MRMDCGEASTGIESGGENYLECKMNKEKVKRKQLRKSHFISYSLILSHLNKELTIKKRPAETGTCIFINIFLNTLCLDSFFCPELYLLIICIVL